jgi:hypothetical protein
MGFWIQEFWIQGSLFQARKFVYSQIYNDTTMNDILKSLSTIQIYLLQT